MFRDRNGHRLFKRVEIEIHFPEKALPFKKIRQMAPAQQGFGPDGLDDLLMKVTDMLEEQFPWWEFKLVEMKPSGRVAKYHFMGVGFNPNYKPPVQTPEQDVATKIAEKGLLPMEPTPDLELGHES
jgi:hypothetical protein